MDFPRIFNRGWKVFEAGFYRKETRLFYTRGLLLRYHERRRSPSFRKFQRARLLLKYEKLGPEKLMEARIIISKSIRRINRSDQFLFISINRNCAIHFSENRRKKEKRERMDGKRVSEKIGGEKIKIALNVSSWKIFFIRPQLARVEVNRFMTPRGSQTFYARCFVSGGTVTSLTRPYPRDILFTTVSTGLCERASSIDPRTRIYAYFGSGKKFTTISLLYRIPFYYHLSFPRFIRDVYRIIQTHPSRNLLIVV